MVVCATLSGWSDADALLCVTSKKGVIAKVTIRDGACKGKESVGDPGVLLGLTTPTTSPPTTTTLPPATPRASRIVDSAGNEVAWVSTPLTPAQSGIWALRTMDGQAIVFPMDSRGPIAVSAQLGAGEVVDDFQNEFWHEGQTCEGDRFSILPDLISLVVGYGDLVKIVYPSTDGKTGYLKTFEPAAVSSLVVSQEKLVYACATPPDPVPPSITCEEEFPLGSVAPVGAAFPCDPDKLEPGSDPTTQCTCIRCCVTGALPPGTPFGGVRVKTIDLGLGNSTPPFRIAP
jgi:hypothetical protein